MPDCISCSVCFRRIWLFLFIFAFVVPSGASARPLAIQQPTASPAEFDGPAELPRVKVKSSLADTPARGKVIQVKAGGDLQAVLDSAACGDTIKLEVGSSFAGKFLLPKKACDDGRWIVIRTSAPDDALPAEGIRLTPCYAGVASLPGRPDFRCASTKNVMARIVFDGHAGSGPIFFAEGANHYRFIGIEITRGSAGASIVDLAGPRGPVPVDHIVFDRVWMHGTAHDETRRGLFLSGTTYIAIVDSFFSDFHCAAKGTCVDSQTISGAAGDLPMGPFKIVNNFLEAAGENILFGGAAATLTPSDIEICHNYFFKPAIWMLGQPGFVGSASEAPFIVKNDFELKNAQRVLFEGNVLENSWGGFSQTGFSILLTPKNPPDNLCPKCRVTDITIRYCKIAHVASGFLIANIPMGGHPAAAGERYSIHDVVIDDIDGQKYGGFGAFMVLTSQQPTLKEVKMNHITATSPRVFLNMGVFGEKLKNFVFTNNLVGANGRQITSTGGGAENCVFQPDRKTPEQILKSCIDSLTFSNNAIINGSSGWPAGNFFPKDVEAVGFARDGSGFGGITLCKAKGAGCKAPSKYVGAGSDRKDIGADIELINAATQGVI